MKYLYLVLALTGCAEIRTDNKSTYDCTVSSVENRKFIEYYGVVAGSHRAAVDSVMEATRRINDRGLPNTVVVKCEK
jgi:hypothetical protein